MTEKVIPLVDLRNRPRIPLIPEALLPANGVLLDKLSRPLHDLRISVTDRCNFRCVYCMPKEVFDKDYAFLPQTALLSFEEITRIAKIAIDHGVEKIRLTGGEPLDYWKALRSSSPRFRPRRPAMICTTSSMPTGAMESKSTLCGESWTAPSTGLSSARDVTSRCHCWPMAFTAARFSLDSGSTPSL